MWFIWLSIYLVIGNFVVGVLYSDEEEEIDILTYAALIFIWPAPLIGYAVTNFYAIVWEIVNNISRRR